MNQINAPRKRAFILTCLALSCLALCVFFSLQHGNVVTAQGNQQPESRADNSPPTEASVLEGTETALQKARKTLIEYSGECDDNVIWLYKSEINALERQLQALNRVKKAKRAEETALNDKLRPLDKKMVEFTNRKKRQEKQWISYPLYVLKWREVKYKIGVLHDTQIKIEHLEKSCKELVKELNNSFSIYQCCLCLF